MLMKTILVLMAGGYGERLGQPKHLITFRDRFLWEYLVENIPCDIVSVLTNRKHIQFWQEYLMKKKPPKPFSVFVEPHERKEDALKMGIFNMYPRMIETFKYLQPNYIIAPIDVYFSDFSFIKKMMKFDNCIAVKRKCIEPNRYGVVDVDFHKVRGFREKPNEKGWKWIFAGVMKIKGDILPMVMTYQDGRAFKNLGDGVGYLISKGVSFNYVKVRGRYLDVGTGEDLNMLKKLEKPNMIEKILGGARGN